MKCVINKISYTIKGIELFGLLITTRKQLENCNISIDIKTFRH